MYARETCTLYRHHIKQITTPQQRHVTLILKIKWVHFVTKDEALKRADTADIDILLIRNRLWGMDNVTRMED